MLKVQHLIDQTMHACSWPLAGWTRTLSSTKAPSSPTLWGRKTALNPRQLRVFLWKNPENFPPQPEPNRERPPLRAPWGMCCRGHGLRRGPRVSKLESIIETCQTAVTYISTLYFITEPSKPNFAPLKYLITRCADTFTEDEQNSLLDTAEKIASYECFLHLFEEVNRSLMVFGIQIEDSSMRSHPYLFTRAEDVNDVCTCGWYEGDTFIHKFKVVTSVL